MEGDCLRIKSNWLKKSIGGILRKVINKKFGIGITELCLNDFDVSPMGDEVLQVHLDVYAVISKNDIQKLIGG